MTFLATTITAWYATILRAKDRWADLGPDLEHAIRDAFREFAKELGELPVREERRP